LNKVACDYILKKGGKLNVRCNFRRHLRIDL
jgi:hypothetical protein